MNTRLASLFLFLFLVLGLLSKEATGQGLDLSDALPVIAPLPAFDLQDDFDDFCAVVGSRSGCSGCEHGTENLGQCAYYVNRVNPLVSVCVSKAHANSFLSSHGTDYVYAGHTCPKDPMEEKKFSFGSKNEALERRLSSLRSHAYASDYCVFTENPWIVDRTMLPLLFNDFNDRPNEDSCAKTNSRSLNQMGFGNLPRCTMETDYDRECMRKWAQLACSVRCNHYGDPIFGFCQDSYEYLDSVCSQSTIVGRCVPETETLLPHLAPTDSVIETCKDMFSIEVSAQFEEDYGFHDDCQPEDCTAQLAEDPTCNNDGIPDDDYETFPQLEFTFSVSLGACGGKSCEQLLFEEFEGAVVDSDDTPITPEAIDCPGGSGTCTVSIYLEVDTPCSPNEEVNEGTCFDGSCGPEGEDCDELDWAYYHAQTDLYWAWASPCSGGCSQADPCGAPPYVMSGWRYATETEFAQRPTKSELENAAGCAARYFDPVHNHCDFSDTLARVPDNGFSEIWLVHA